MKEAILKLQKYKNELQKHINVSIKNDKLLRVSIARQEMIGIDKAIEVLES